MRESGDLPGLGLGAPVGPDLPQTSTASSNWPWSISQRGDSGTRSMPMNNAAAGNVTNASMIRQTPPYSPQTFRRSR